VRADEVQRIALHDDVGLFQLCAARADGLDFPAFEHHAGLEVLLDKIIVEGFFIFNDTHTSILTVRALTAFAFSAAYHSCILVPEVVKSVLVPYSADEMFALVDDVPHYPEFLPWCNGAQSVQLDAHTTRATLQIHFRGLKQRFTTDNTKLPPRELTMRLVEGPFRALDGAWRFNDLNGRGCKIEFRLHYEFSNRVLAAVVGPVFGWIADTLVEAFVKRAGQVYGAR
jgi:ribosome-associated toxin RatA of RatAB toxin-antitoxin module